MFYSLAHLDESFHKDNLSKAIMLAPCIVDPVDPSYFDYVNKFEMTYQSKAGVYKYSGPNWDRDYQSLCDTYGEEHCSWYKGIKWNVP